MLARILAVCLLCSLSACATSSKVKRGALWGAVAGGVVGAGGAWVISDPKLRGTEAGPRHGDTELEVGPSIAAGAAIGVLVGAIVGAMVGHQQAEHIERKPRTVEGEPPAGEPSSSAALEAQPRL